MDRPASTPMKNTICIENSDCRIWNSSKVMLELISAAMSDSSVIIDLNSEGPCAESLGLYQLLDDICDQFNVDSTRFTINTCNQLEFHDRYNIVKLAPCKGISKIQEQLNTKPAGYKEFLPSTYYFGNFVGHSNRLRLALSSHLYTNHKNKTLQSYHTDIKNAYFDQFIGLENLMFHDYTPKQIDQAFEFIKNTPIKLDEIKSYPILHEEKVYDILDYYPNIFLDIVNQTYFTGNTFYLDDHLWRSIITKTPFIVQGPQNFIKNLRRLGFQTFDQWWDEGFSEDPPDVQVVEIIKIIDEIAQWDLDRITTTYDQMKSVLDHNYKRFMELNYKEFSKEFLYD